MEIYLLQTQIDQIRTLYEAGPNAQGNYSHIYKFIGDMLPNGDVKNWFRGAEQANAGQGAYSAVIRTYSQRQMQLRAQLKGSASHYFWINHATSPTY